MTNYIDLHVHSTASDGTCSPSELVELAIQKGLRAFALTDHDTTDGIDEALEAARDTDLEVIRGIEFSTNYKGHDIHVVGLDMDHHDPKFMQTLADFKDGRNLRNLKMMEKMREHGIDISVEKLKAAYPDITGVWTRAHFARFMLDFGYVSERQEAFDKYLADDACCFVPRVKVSPFDIPDVVHAAGGYVILAHPLLYGLTPEELEELVSKCKEVGFDGMETMYSRNKEGDEERMRALAEKYNLKVSGGSDFHGANKPDIDLGTGMDNLKITYDVWENIRK